MEWKEALLKYFLFCCLWQCVLTQEDGASGTRRKKLRKKVDDSGQSLNTTRGILQDNFENQNNSSLSTLQQEGDHQETSSAERAGRGFLDEYYSKYEDRVQNSQVDKLRANERMDMDAELDFEDMSISNKTDDEESDISLMKAEHRTIIPGEFRKYPDGLGTSNKMGAIKKPSVMLTPETTEPHYIQQLTIPKKQGSEPFMISATPLPNIDLMSDLMTTKTKRKTMTSGLVPPADKYEMTDLEPILTSDKGYNSVESSSSLFDGSALDPRDAMSKFFGLTGTTSKDIQLGLTFTVPFMSIPLNGISELMNGQGLSDAMNFNFAPTAIVTIIILGIILIFVLPQIIYWATGINTSAFSWGRKGDEDHGIHLSNLAHSVDEALLKYDIDVRSCVARLACNEYQSRAKDSRTASRISRGLLENLADNHLVKFYLGEQRLNEAIERGSSTKGCSKFYPDDVCPWDSSAMLKIVTKLVTSGNIDLGSLASAYSVKDQ